MTRRTDRDETLQVANLTEMTRAASKAQSEMMSALLRENWKLIALAGLLGAGLLGGVAWFAVWVVQTLAAG